MALLHVNFHSYTLGMATQMDVILPQRPLAKEKADLDNESGETYPVLYLLHGMSDDHTIWQRRTSIERYATEYNIAVVMPEGHISWYSDMYHGHKYLTFLTYELPAIVHDMFPRVSTKREDTFIGGNSMGGHGALKLALHRPDLYSAVISLSGALDMRQGLGDRRPAEFWENIFGPLDKFEGSANDLISLAEKAAASGKELPRVFIWCGTEDFLYNHNTVMRDKLTELKYDLTYSECSGNHGWLYWDIHIQDGLKWLFEGRK